MGSNKSDFFLPVAQSERKELFMEILVSSQVLSSFPLNMNIQKTVPSWKVILTDI